MQGPIWYRAAKYGTQQEAFNALNKLKAGVAHLRGENLLTLMFSNPAVDYFVAAVGYPSPSARAQVEKLIAHPVTLNNEEIGFMRDEVSKVRRGRGMSDREATRWAEHRLDAAGLPEEIKREVLRDYTGESEPFTGQLASSSPALPGLQAGAPLKLQRIPFLIGYRDIQAQALGQTPGKYHVPESRGTQALTEAMNIIIWRKLKRAEKYQFDSSAIAMLNTVRDSAATTWLPLESPLWVEFTQALQTTHGEDIRALYAHPMNLESDIREVAPASRDLTLYRLLMERNELYKGYWSFNVVTGHCKELFDFTYDVAQGRYVYLYSHVCPSGKCAYTVPETRYSLGECSPCLECQSALTYWASVLHTAIRMIRREYALAPEEPSPWAARPEGYSETVNVKVGKGKNARHVREEKRREVAYRLVSYEVSEIGYPARALAEEIIEREESAAQGESKRPNWLKLAQADAIIWEYRAIDTSKGRTLDPEHNPRWKSYQHIEIAPFKKWVPMLRESERKTIKRVTARRYAAREPRNES